MNPKDAPPTRFPLNSNPTANEPMTLDEVCNWYARCILNLCGGHRSVAAEVLGISRTTLYRYLKDLDCEEQGSATSSDFKTIGNHAHHETVEINDPAQRVSARSKLVNSLRFAVMCDQI